jgi:hypothetical protein
MVVASERIKRMCRNRHAARKINFIKKPSGKRLQGAVDARRRACRRTKGLQMPGNEVVAVPCERLQCIKLGQNGKPH